MKLNTLFLLLGMLVSALPAAAQQSEAQSVLERTERAFRQSGGVKISFTLRSLQGSSNGTICLKNDKFRLDTEDVTTWFDGQTQWTYLSSANEVTISKPTAAELQTLNPYAWLSLYKDKDYKLEMLKADKKLGANTYIVMMTATKATQDVQCLVICVDKKTWRPSKLSVMPQGSGEAVAIIINGYQEGRYYPNDFFVFDKNIYPKVEVIDLR